jgi:hypothetical protein
VLSLGATDFLYCAFERNCSGRLATGRVRPNGGRVACEIVASAKACETRGLQPRTLSGLPLQKACGDFICPRPAAAERSTFDAGCQKRAPPDHPARAGLQPTVGKLSASPTD